MKFSAGHPFADPEAAARKRDRAPLMVPSFAMAAAPVAVSEWGRTFAVQRDWIKRHETGTHVKPAEHGIECQPVVERETKPSHSRLLSLEPADLLESMASSGRSGMRKA